MKDNLEKQKQKIKIMTVTILIAISKAKTPMLTIITVIHFINTLTRHAFLQVAQIISPILPYLFWQNLSFTFLKNIISEAGGDFKVLMKTRGSLSQKQNPEVFTVVFSNSILDKKSGDFSMRNYEALLPWILSFGEYDVAVLQNSLKGITEHL